MLVKTNRYMKMHGETIKIILAGNFSSRMALQPLGLEFLSVPLWEPLFTGIVCVIGL
jgi:hypothetical protein